MSAALALTGFAVGLWAYRETRNKAMLAGAWYFVLMEVLQFFQYFWVGQCDSRMNQVLTVLGFLHICFQPYFTHLFSGAFIKNEKKLAQMQLIRKMALFMGCMMFSRWVLFTDEHKLKSENTEWIRGDSACTFYGNYHIAWSVPLHAPTYFMPSNNIHFFMMFIPYFAMWTWDMWINGFILLTTGPLLSKLITNNLYEQASIWCFMSIGQVLLAIFMLRFQLKTPKKDLWTAQDKTGVNGIRSACD
jgi:hypothetical protein